MNIEIANRLVNLRKEKGLSQEQLAEKIGVSRQAVSKWERSEASPDTDNIILLARLYNISLDELLKTEDDIPESEEPEADGFEQTETEANEENDTFGETINDNGEESSDGYYKESPNGDKVHIGIGGIDVHDHNGAKVHVGFDGIFVNDAPNGDNVHIGKNGIFVNEKQFTKEDFKNWHKEHNRFTIPIVTLSIIGFLCFGFLNPGGWRYSWLCFFAVPILCSLESAIRNRNPSDFAYPVLTALIFFYMGLLPGLWHPGWVAFTTIPLYYFACALSKGKDIAHHIYPVLLIVAYVILGVFFNLWHPLWIVFLTIPIYYWIISIFKKK